MNNGYSSQDYFVVSLKCVKIIQMCDKNLHKKNLINIHISKDFTGYAWIPMAPIKNFFFTLIVVVLFR